jgi:PleD family two-component response regulator
MSKQELLEMADKAMYAGKSSGKNCVRRFIATS